MPFYTILITLKHLIDTMLTNLTWKICLYNVIIYRKNIWKRDKEIIIKKKILFLSNIFIYEFKEMHFYETNRILGIFVKKIQTT